MSNNWKKRNITCNLKELPKEVLIDLRDMLDLLIEGSYSDEIGSIDESSTLYFEYDRDFSLLFFVNEDGDRWFMEDNDRLDCFIECKDCGAAGTPQQLIEWNSCSECDYNVWSRMRLKYDKKKEAT